MISFNLITVDLFNLFTFIYKFLKKLMAKYEITFKDLAITECKLIHVSVIIFIFLRLLKQCII